MEELCAPAFIGTLETSMPRMSKICPVLGPVWGGVECWGENAPKERRWRKVLAAGTGEGEEMARSWALLTRKAYQSVAWLGEGHELPKVFSCQVEGIGDGSVTGDTRRLIVQTREVTRAKMLDRALELHRPQRDRVAWSWRQRDKISSAWKLCLPIGSFKLSNAEFSEAAAADLVLPSPGCAERVGEVVKPGRRPRKLDIYGDALQATCFPGDHWRQRHDQMKLLLGELCSWAAVPCTVEVFNLFSGLLQQQGLSRIDSHRDRQAMLPDFRITLNLQGQSIPTLQELKIISASRTRYKVTQMKKAVDKRADKIHEEYLLKARTADQNYGGAVEGEQGRVERKLLSYPKVEGLIFGAWGEASEAVHSLVEVLASSRARVADPQRKRKGGYLGEEGVKTLAVGYLRRRLSVCAVQAQCLSLLGRLEVMGPGQAAASGRRQAAADQEQLWRRERAAQQLAERQGFNALRRGCAKLD